MSQVERIGVIGGSGLYEMEGLEIIDQVEVDTPFGKPSDPLTLGKVGDKEVVFLTRHGKGHRYLPSEVNFRANIWALKKMRAHQIFSVSAVGSLKEEIYPGLLVFPNQFIDRTYKRQSTFFGEGIVAHVALAHPICPRLVSHLKNTTQNLNISSQDKAVYLCMEGPQFSSQAESNLYRLWGADVIGMTNSTEAKLAREAQICYATIALSTDYDCWHPGHDAVSAEQVIKTLKENVEKAKKVLMESIQTISIQVECSCRHALKNAIMTDEKVQNSSKKAQIELLFE